MNRAFLEVLFNIVVVRWAAAVTFALRGVLFLVVGNCYRGMSDLCWVSRVSGVTPLKRVADTFIWRMIDRVKCGKENILFDSYLSSKASVACASLYSLTGLGSHDIFRDVIVLKTATVNEKGVILLKYARTFDAVIALFDLQRLLDRYLFVLEPCWAGYCDPSILMFIARDHPVIVQCFTDEDYRFISSIGAPLVPIRLGPADWVDADLFSEVRSDDKTYDLVMVANWERHKRHAQLFQALSKINDRKLRVLLIGFPLGRRTAADIRQEAAVIRSPLIEIEILEKIPAREVASLLSRCKVFVFLSRKEGDNKALVEAMFVGVPAIVFSKSTGGARSRINQSTGMLVSDEELSEKIVYMLDHYAQFNPRSWAVQHSGSSVATQALNDLIKRITIDVGGSFTESIAEKTNAPNLTYKDPTQRNRFAKDYEYILSCQRHPIRSP